MPLNAALEGKVYPPVSFVIDPDRVALYRAALGEEADIVPPTVGSAAEFVILPPIVGDPELGLDFTRVVHGEQEYEWRRPFKVGETLSIHARISSIREKAGHAFLTIETEMRDGDGALVVVARATMIERGAL